MTVPVAIALALLLSSALLVACGGSGGSTGPGTDEDITAGVPDSPDCPVRNHLAADANGLRRSGVEMPIDYAFLEARRGGCLPVRFNPCEPIRYVVNATLAPEGSLDDLQTAIAKVEAATGLSFVSDGPTDEPATINRPIFQPQRYGARWAPILIVWAHGAEYKMESTNPAGGRSFRAEDSYVSGVLIVNVDAGAADGGSSRPARGFGPGNTWGRVFIHELSHIVGLGHVARSDQIMFPELGVQRGDAEFHPGDAAGLVALGREAGCLATPPPGQ